MTSNKSEYLKELGERLAEERNRCGHTQMAVAERFEMTARTQIKYELGETGPDAYYLHRIAEIGLDVPYVLSGRRSVIEASNGEGDLIAAYRKVDPEIQSALTEVVKRIAQISRAGSAKRRAQDSAELARETQRGKHRR
ncbi:helix-turn-helix transcriptional regulator [Herbaspirillum sp. WKF16]|uniref:helix-turn-helix domain-containing protein n=1 Tax=Herbaspirillum sp. WKF16 TaxID=3028312 RepID=UPI0023A9797C|nr:helix-turn-helix transcriptional regulator [Herbaspirillum sp. WKF16]WDZ94638.1 helix-turn-helix transcriptional regulator [Herbaspirillum sp. WKF16]